MKMNSNTWTIYIIHSFISIGNLYTLISRITYNVRFKISLKRNCHTKDVPKFIDHLSINNMTLQCMLNYVWRLEWITATHTCKRNMKCLNGPLQANLNYILKTIFSVLHYTFAEQLDSVFTRYAVSMVIQNFTMNPWLDLTWKQFGFQI